MTNFLARRTLGGDAVRIEQQKPVQKEARRDPGENELHQVARQHQQEHRGQRHAEPAGERALPRLTVQIGRGVAHHDPADERDQEEHHDADSVEPDRQTNALQPDQAAVPGTVQDEQCRRDRRDHHREKGRGFSQPRKKARPAARVHEAEGRAQKQRQGGGNGQKIDWQRFSPSTHHAGQGKRYPTGQA